MQTLKYALASSITNRGLTPAFDVRKNLSSVNNVKILNSYI